MHINNSKKQIKTNPNLIITDRDLDIFRSIARYHLTGRMLFKLSQTFDTPFTSVGNTRTRLGQLHQTNLLKRDQRLLRGRSSNEYYYFLTKKSASLFDELRRLNDKNAVFKPISLINQAHGFLISEMMVKLELDASLFQDICRLVGFIRENQFEVIGEEKRVIRPDGTIFLNVNGRNFLFFLEIDRSTTVVRSDDHTKRTFEKKIKTYSEFKNYFGKSPIIHSFEGIRGYRVLTICKSPQRVQNLLDLAKDMNKTTMFWFTTANVFLSKDRNCLFDRIWILPDRKIYPLF